VYWGFNYRLKSQFKYIVYNTDAVLDCVKIVYYWGWLYQLALNLYYYFFNYRLPWLFKLLFKIAVDFYRFNFGRYALNCIKMVNKSG